MKYKLAKQLKDAGFPQEGEDFIGGDGDLIHCLAPDDNCYCPRCRSWGEEYQIAYLPNLSELIEACGDDFDSLIKDFEEKNNWTATARDPKSTDSEFLIASDGPTPEEAVAKLWLELNKK